MKKIIDGKEIASRVKEQVIRETEKFIIKYKFKPCLAILLVGNDPASASYVRSKEKNSKDMNFDFIMCTMPETSSQDDVLDTIKQWNNNPAINGILVQLPLPKHIDENLIIQSINPKKDVDGFHPENMGKLVIGLDSLIPCTPAGIVEMIKHENIETQGKHIVVVGRSNIVGKPIANLLYQKKEFANGIVTICHSATKDISEFTKSADILIVAVGVPQLIKKEHIKEGVVIIDVGINRIDASNEKGYKLVGDVDYDDVYDKCSKITPVPGGVGPMTIAMLMSNTLKAAKFQV